jgi:hypothetical protein
MHNLFSSTLLVSLELGSAAIVSDVSHCKKPTLPFEAAACQQDLEFHMW